MKKVLLDSSVILAGIHSTKGASSLVLELAKRKEIVAFVSSMIVQEVIRNLKKKFPAEDLERFLKFLPVSNFRKIEFKDEKEILKFRETTADKDIHVLAAAFKAKAAYLITLDKKHLLHEEVNKKVADFKIVTPGEFLRSL